MSGVAVSLEGLDTVEASCAAVVAALQDPATAAQVANLVRANAHPPRDAGTLADTARVVGTELVYPVPYSAIVHARHPWLGDAITATITDQVALYETNVLEAWD